MPYNNVISRTDAAALIPENVSQAMMSSLSATSAALELGTVVPVATSQTRFPVLCALIERELFGPGSPHGDTSRGAF